MYFTLTKKIKLKKLENLLSFIVLFIYNKLHFQRPNIGINFSNSYYKLNKRNFSLKSKVYKYNIKTMLLRLILLKQFKF